MQRVPSQKVPKAPEGSPLYGAALLAIDMGRYVQWQQEELRRQKAGLVVYGFGAKDRHLNIYPPQYVAIDCSGEVRAILDYATNGLITKLGFPDGSAAQYEWFRDQGFRENPYAQVAGLCDGHVRVAGHLPGGRGGDSIGHIWLLCNHDVPGVAQVALTFESYGHHGPGRRPWNNDWFMDHVDWCFTLC